MAIELIEEVGSVTLRNPTKKYNRVVVARKMQGDSERIDARAYSDDRFTAAGLWLSPEDVPELIVKLQEALDRHNAAVTEAA